MGLIILTIVGALFGWLATIALKIENGRAILHNILLGIGASLVVGIATSGGIFLGTIQASALLWAVIGAIIVIGLYNFFRKRAHR